MIVCLNLATDFCLEPTRDFMDYQKHLLDDKILINRNQ